MNNPRSERLFEAGLRDITPMVARGICGSHFLAALPVIDDSIGRRAPPGADCRTAAVATADRPAYRLAERERVTCLHK
jgi:hypothetical protein